VSEVRDRTRLLTGLRGTFKDVRAIIQRGEVGNSRLRRFSVDTVNETSFLPLVVRGRVDGPIVMVRLTQPTVRTTERIVHEASFLLSVLRKLRN
jgi:hypothetical protein